MHTRIRSTLVFVALVSCACSTTVGAVPPEDAGADLVEELGSTANEVVDLHADRAERWSRFSARLPI
jgi:hypothetical protein